MTEAGFPRETAPVRAEDAAEFRPYSITRMLDVAGELLRLRGGQYYVIGANSRWLALQTGDYVVRYGPGDLGVMSAGEFRRHFPDDDGRHPEGCACQFCLEDEAAERAREDREDQADNEAPDLNWHPDGTEETT